MPRGPKGEKRPADVIGAAVMIGKIATGEIDDLTTDDGKNAAAVALGRMGGKARAEGMSAKRRKEIARKAAVSLTQRQNTTPSAYGRRRRYGNLRPRKEASNRGGVRRGKLWQGLLTGKRTVRSAYWGMSESSGHRSCRCGAVYDRSEHMVAEREISSFECAVCGATIENWNSAWVPRYQFIARPARTPKDKPPQAS
jgi:hypothetical protein